MKDFGTISFNFNIKSLENFFKNKTLFLLLFLLTAISVLSYIVFYQNGLGLAYNDARSHLDIGRRVVEGLKPGLAQLGSVWLPLTHAMMIPTIWNDFMWHSGLSGALWSMIGFVATGLLIYSFLKKLKVGILGQIVGVLIFALNLNILYLQSTAMTELVLIATMTAGVYYLLQWAIDKKITSIIASGFFIFLSTLVRYDGWFLLAMTTFIIGIVAWYNFGKKSIEGLLFFFLTLSSFGIVLWFLWNALIFKDPLYFAFGPYSARTQQEQLQQAGVLATKGNLWLSLKIYFYALVYNSGALSVILGTIGAFVLWFDKKLSTQVKVVSAALIAPLFFNVLALYLGHSVLFIQGLSGNTWFNVRYGVMLLPSLAIFIGYLVHKLKDFRLTIIGLLIFVNFFAIANVDAVTIDDARVGSSQKNVSQVAGWLHDHAQNNNDYVLISVASHDAIIFSSGLPMKRFIHEGTGSYWESATSAPDRWARYIIMRTNDVNDQTFKLLKGNEALLKYDLVLKGDFADIYEIKGEESKNLPKEPLKPIRK